MGGQNTNCQLDWGKNKGGQKLFHCTPLYSVHNQLFFRCPTPSCLFCECFPPNRINHWIPHQRCHTRQIATFPDLPQLLIAPNQTVTVYANLNPVIICLIVWCWSCTCYFLFCSMFAVCALLSFVSASLQWSRNSRNRGTNDYLNFNLYSQDANNQEKKLASYMEDITSENYCSVEKVAEIATFCFFSMLGVILLTVILATRILMAPFG